MLIHRLGIALLTLLFTASAVDAMMLCAGMAMAADNPHACCVGEAPKPTSPEEAMACCAMAERSDDQAAPEVSAGVGIAPMLQWQALHEASPPGPTAGDAPWSSGPRRAPPSVPLYLRHHTLLI